MLKEGKLYRDNVAKDLIVLKIKNVMPDGNYEAKIVKSYRENLSRRRGILDKCFEDDFVLYKQRVRRLKWWKLGEFIKM